MVDKQQVEIDSLATLDEIFTIGYSFYIDGTKFGGTYIATWGHILKIVGPNLYSPRPSSRILRDIKSHIEQVGPGVSYITVNQMHADTIRIHLHALGLLNIEAAGAKQEKPEDFISLTQKGKAELVKLMSVRTEIPSAENDSEIET